jgi:hypothetical protein
LKSAWYDVRGADLLLRLRIQPRASREGMTVLVRGACVCVYLHRPLKVPRTNVSFDSWQRRWMCRAPR